VINLKKYIPEGTRDILFEECSAKVKIENILRDIYLNHGYHEVISPTLEFYDVFDLENQPIAQEKMYKLFDNLGRILVLRPDMTTPIARIAGTKINEEIYPLKLCYNSNVYRVNESLNGKLSEFTQSGVEIIGVKSLRADVEAIITSIKIFNKIGLSSFKIEIGESQFFKYIIEDLNLDDEEKEALRLYIQNKNISALREFLGSKSQIIDKNTTEILQKLPELFGGIEVLEEVKALIKNKKALMAIENIKNIYTLIDSLGMSEYISIDLGMVQHINYYTGLIFRGYCIGAGNDILSGGRYDTLIESFGKKLPATGFALNIDSILNALAVQGMQFENKKIQKLIFCLKDELLDAYELLDKLNKDGFSAEVSLYEKESEALEYGKKRNIQSFINLSTKNSYELKNGEWVETNFSI
jgi:ATP phosphoribosyltransferase regulatory subunit